MNPAGIILNPRPKKPLVEMTCPTCGTTFKKESWKPKIYCKKSCSPNMGGVRENSGRSKSGWYKGIYCGSTYELVWVIYQLDHNIEFSRYDGYIEYDNGRKYFPDFIANGCIIEIKGYHNNDVDLKVEACKNADMDIKVLYKQDLFECFHWVKDRYEYSQVTELYDDYKPKYDYECSFCGDIFSTDRKRTTQTKFCGQSCAGKYNHR